MPYGLDSFVLLGLIFLGVLVFILNLRRRAGAAILDLGYINRDRWKSSFVVGLLWAVCGVLWFFDHRPLTGMGFLLLGASQIMLASQHFQITQNGIVCKGGKMGVRLIRWEEILSYSLAEQGTLSLNLRTKGWTTCGNPVPFDDRPRVDALMASRLPNHTPAGV